MTKSEDRRARTGFCGSRAQLTICKTRHDILEVDNLLSRNRISRPVDSSRYLRSFEGLDLLTDQPYGSVGIPENRTHRGNLMQRVPTIGSSGIRGHSQEGRHCARPYLSQGADRSTCAFAAAWIGSELFQRRHGRTCNRSKDFESVDRPFDLERCAFRAEIVSQEFPSPQRRQMLGDSQQIVLPRRPFVPNPAHQVWQSIGADVPDTDPDVLPAWFSQLALVYPCIGCKQFAQRIAVPRRVPLEAEKCSSSCRQQQPADNQQQCATPRFHVWTISAV
jgi:hypothetical protein